MDSRAEFEAWFRSIGMRDRDLTREEDGNYFHRAAFDTWNAWLASRAAMKPIPAYDLVSRYAERPTSDREMIEFARAVEAHHGIRP